jgi:hypothetical protein
VRVAAQNLLTRLTEFHSIPITDSSPVMLGCLDTNEIRTAKNSISSAVEYVDKEGGAWGRKGAVTWGTNDERVPRPIHGALCKKVKSNG